MRIEAKIIIVAVFMLAVSAIVGANLHRDHDFLRFRWKIDSKVPLEVRLESAQLGSIVRTVEAPGDVEAEIEVEISSQVVSRIVELPVREGDTVQRGDLLAQLDDIDFQAQVRSAEARIERIKAMITVAEADVTKSQRDFEQGQQLAKKGAASTTELADYETVVAKSKAMLSANKAEHAEAQAALAKAKEDLADTTILAPISGLVSRLTAEQGEVVVIGTMNNAGTVMMTISDMDSVVVRCRIDETDVPHVKPDQQARIHLQYDQEQSLSGSVKRVAPKGIKGNRGAAALQSAANSDDVASFETLIQIDSPPPELRLGMTANVEIEVDRRSQTLVVPSQAVLHRQAKDLPPELAKRLLADDTTYSTVTDPAKRYHQIIFVAAGGVARAYVVKTGISDQSRVEIVEGLEEGDRVIAGPYRIFEKLEDGMAIREMTDETKSE